MKILTFIRDLVELLHQIGHILFETELESVTVPNANEIGVIYLDVVVEKDLRSQCFSSTIVKVTSSLLMASIMIDSKPTSPIFSFILITRPC